ncbi:MAG TPA: hypothetical protein DCM27_02730 [Rhodospirillaceae bacterium]|nr:hypothetical protein [Rhodospirillaceae bacterium]
MIKFAPPPQTVQSPENKAFSMVSGKNDRMAGSVPVWKDVASFAENIADKGNVAGKDKSFGFADIVDIVNPLQHIPVVSNLYQSATGDTMGAIAQIVGGAIFGGPVGALVSAGFVAYHAAKESEVTGDPQLLAGTTIALADLRQGYKPYNS